MRVRRHRTAPDATLRWIIAFWVVLASGLPTGAGAEAAQTSPTVPSIVVDGIDWMEASSLERRAFLLGVGNMIVAETAYAKHQQLATPPASDRIVAAVKEMKLGEIEDRITGWYEANTSKQSFPVMGVVWQHLVKQQP